MFLLYIYIRIKIVLKIINLICELISVLYKCYISNVILSRIIIKYLYNKIIFYSIKKYSIGTIKCHFYLSKVRNMLGLS